MRKKRKTLAFLILASLLSLLCLAGISLLAQSVKANPGIPVGRVWPPLEKICDYPIVAFSRRNLVSGASFDPTFLDQARSCGTKVFIWLYGETKDILNDNGVGLNLHKYEDRINDFAGLIDPYIEDGTIIGHLTIDEPHDCHDWDNELPYECPLPPEVDQAGEISKKYWPNLPTVVNTIPGYASRRQWQYTDIINFQYAYHKGPLDQFVNGAVRVLEEGYINDISWSMMITQGGCSQYGQCPMTPEQVVEVGTTMCATGKGIFLLLLVNEGLIDDGMNSAIDQVKTYCEGSSSCAGPADVNCDSQINIQDVLLVLRNWFSSSPTPSRADVNGDGKVNGMDFGLVVASL